MARIEITKEYAKAVLGLDPRGFQVVAWEGGMTISGKCIRGNCKNAEKIVDISPEGTVEVLNCTGSKDDCNQ